MAEPIRVDFQVGGIKDVLEAFRTVTKAAREFGDQVNATAKARSRGNARAKAEGDALSREEIKRAREYDAYYKRLIRERNAFAQRQAIADQRNQTNEAKRAARERARADEAESRRGALAVVRGFLAAEREKTLEAKRAARERTRAEEAESRRGALAIVRGFLNAEKEKTRAAEREERARLRATEVANRSRDARAKTIASRIVGSASGAISTVGGAAGMVTGLMGGFTIADSVQKGLDARGAAADLANQSGRKVSSKEILERSSAIATTYGMDTTDVIKGLDAFVAKSGDVVGGLKGLQDLTELVVATGGSMQDALQAAGIIHQGTGGDIAETLRRMRVEGGMGRQGSVDFRELAQYSGRISAGSNQFVNKGRAFDQLSAIVQQAAATGGATAAPEATEAVTRLATDVFEKQEAFAAYGIKTKDASGKYLVDPMQLIKQSIVKTGGDSSKLLELFGKMSYRAVAGFQDVYNRAGGGKKGETAIDAAFKTFLDAQLSVATIKQDVVDRLQEPDKRFIQILNSLRDQIANVAIPALEKLAPRIVELIPAFLSLVDRVLTLAKFFADNPFLGLAGAVSGAITGELIKATIGQVVANSIATAIAASSAVIAAQVAGAITGVVTSAIYAVFGTYMGSRGNPEDQKNENKKNTVELRSRVGEAVNETTRLARELSDYEKPGAVTVEHGAPVPVTKQDIEDKKNQLQNSAARVKALIEEVNAKKGNAKDSVEELLGPLLLGRADYDVKRKYENEPFDDALKKMTDALSALTSVLDKKDSPPMLRPETNQSMATPMRASP